VFGVREALSAWDLDPTPTIGVALAGLGYGAARRRLIGRPDGVAWPRGRTAVFGGGLLVMLLAVDGSPDTLADRSFAAHMVQHLLIQLVAAPLLVLGAPMTLLLRADPSWLPRRLLARTLRARTVRLLSPPAVTFAVFSVVLVGSHLSPLYDLALRYNAIHQAEHVAYLVTAYLFWWSTIGVDPSPAKPNYPARILYLLLIMPVMAFLGVAIAGSGRVMYPHYAANPPPWDATALQDQQLAGTLMWITGMVTIPPTLALVLLRWLDQDDRDQARRSAARPAAARVGDG
jgi:putative copper resistance protein D